MGESIRLYKTLVKGDDCRSKNQYNIGRINGIMFVICSRVNEKPYGNRRKPEGTILKVETTEARYSKFCKIIDYIYPGLCKFDYERI